MDKYRRTVKRRIYRGVAVVLFSAGMCILDRTGLFEQLAFFKNHVEVSAFQLGLLIGIAFVVMIWISKYGKALKDETKLQMLYNKEHDERQNLIRQKAGMPMLMVTSGIMVFAGIVAGYINETVFFALIAAAMVQLTLGVIVKLYYMRKI